MLNVTQTFLPPLEEYVHQLERIWDSRWLTNRGLLVTELEEKLAELLEIDGLLAVSNGTIALQIAIKALGLQGEIITTPFSYVATLSSIVWENCDPKFVDIHPVYYSIDEEKIENAITDRTVAILATHVYGNPCNVTRIKEIADRFGLKVIYDAAHCFGVRFNGESILRYGDVSTLSFHATKLFHTGEGGAIVCPEKSLRDTIYYHHNFGHRGEEDFWGLGINGKMSELNAAMGLTVLPHLKEIVARRKAICNLYDEQLAESDLQTIKIRPGTEWNFAYYPVLFHSAEELLHIKGALNERCIYPRRYFYPSLNVLPYLVYQEVPIAEDVSRRIICLPLSAEITSEQAEGVCSVINNNL